MRDIAAVRDQHQHHFAGAESLLHHDVAKKAASGFFIVGSDAKLSADTFYSGNDRVVILMLNQTSLHVDNPVAAPGIEAAHKPAFGYTDGHLGFVAVAPRLVHTQRWADDNAVRARERICRIAAIARCLSQLDPRILPGI
ncbi:hypothetical protein D3C74_396280 [compost metagenome]